MRSLQSALKNVAKRLNEGDLLQNLMEEDSEAKQWTTANLSEIVQWRMKQYNLERKTYSEDREKGLAEGSQ